MNRIQSRPGTWAPYSSQIAFMNEGIDGAFRGALSDYLAMSEDFFISGAEVSQTPAGTSTNIAITDGYLVFKGEVVSVDAHSVVKLSSQVVYLALQDDGVDTTPVPNLDGTTDYVMRKRHARLAVGPVYPAQYMSVAAPRKEQLDRQRYRGRLVVPGMIMPYTGPTNVFDATGKGLSGQAMDGWAICNGNNGTLDMRGLAAIGATNVPDSGADAVHSAVSGASDPNTVVGNDDVTIVAANLPEHQHGHVIATVGGTGGDVAGGSDYQRSNITGTTDNNVTPNTPISVKQASMALVWVQSIV